MQNNPIDWDRQRLTVGLTVYEMIRGLMGDKILIRSGVCFAEKGEKRSIKLDGSHH